MVDWDKYEREQRKIETIVDEEPSVRDGMSDGLGRFKEWLVRLLDSGTPHASERYDSWEEEPYCKMCGEEGIEGGDVDEEGVSVFLCDHCEDKL